MPRKQRQMLQHIGVHLVPRLQGERLPFLCLGSWLPGQRIDLAAPGQLQISLLVAHLMDPGKQRHTVAVGATEVAAVLIRISVEAQMIFPRSVVAAEGTARLDLLSPQRPGVEDEPAPSGRIHNGDFVIRYAGQTGSPPLAYAARCTGPEMGPAGRTCSWAPLTHLAMITCPVGRTLARSSMDSILSTNTG